MAASPSLSEDVMAMVVDLLAPVLADDAFDTPLERERQRELVSLSLVSHDWSVVARRALSRSIIISTAAQAKRIAAAADDGRFDVSAIRSITIIGDPGNGDDVACAMRREAELAHDCARAAVVEGSGDRESLRQTAEALEESYWQHQRDEAETMMRVGLALFERAQNLDVTRIGDVSRVMDVDENVVWRGRAMVIDVFQFRDHFGEPYASYDLPYRWLATTLARSPTILAVTVRWDLSEEAETSPCPFGPDLCARLRALVLGCADDAVRMHTIPHFLLHPLRSLTRLSIHVQLWDADDQDGEHLAVLQLFGPRRLLPILRELSVRCECLIGRLALSELCLAAPSTLERLSLSWIARSVNSQGLPPTLAADTPAILRAFRAVLSNDRVLPALGYLAVKLIIADDLSAILRSDIRRATDDLGAVVLARGVVFRSALVDE